MVANDLPYSPPTTSWRVSLTEKVLFKLGKSGSEQTGKLGQLGEAIAVGVLGKTHLNELMSKVYQEQSKVYNPRDYQLDCETKILPYLRAYHSRGKLLSAFCGQGREAKFFSDQGFDVTGIDASPAMIQGAVAYAKEVGFPAQFEQADFFQYRPAMAYDVIYISPWMYGTFPDPADRIKLLQHCATALAPNGVIVMSYIRLLNPERLWEKLRHGLATVAAKLSGNAWQPRLGDRFYVRIFHHFFTPGELHREVDTARLKILDQQESDNGLFDFCILGK